MNFKKLLDQKNISQAEIGRRLNVTRGMVSFWCNGKNTPTIHQVVKLSKLLNTPIETIVLMFYKEVKPDGKEK